MSCTPFSETLDLFKRYDNEVTEYFKLKATEKAPERIAAKRLGLSISFSEIMLSMEQLMKSGMTIGKILNNNELKGHEVTIVMMLDKCVDLANLVLDNIDTESLRTKDTLKYKCLEIMDKLSKFINRL